MLWGIVVAVIAVLGLLMLVGYAIWLAHKAADLLSELKVLGERGGRLAALIGEIGPAAYTRNVRSGTVVEEEDSWVA